MGTVKALLQAIVLVSASAILIYSLWISAILIGVLLMISAVYFVLKQDN